MARLRIGEILIKQGLLTEVQLMEAINLQKTEKGRLGEILLKLGMVKEEDFASALASQLMLPFASYASKLLRPRSDQNLDRDIPMDFARKNNVLPISKENNVLTCAVFDPLDFVMQDNLKIMTNCELRFMIATKTDLAKAINDFYLTSSKGSAGDKRATLLDRVVERTYDDGVNGDQQITTKLAVETELSIDRLIAKAEEAPVVKLVDLIIRQAIDEKASDIHVEPFKERLEIRYRIDGALYQIPPPASHLTLPIISRIKILAKMDIAEKRLPQDGAISAKLEDRVVDIRVSTVPTVWGEKVVMRLLDKGAVKLNLEGLGYNKEQLALIRKALQSSYGLFFVTGPTGSGKSTTLYSCLSEVIDPTLNIMTAEDPVEFKIDGINQVGMKSDIGLTFASVLRAFLRQDPDIIMVGEVRDLETAQICVRAALTGHMVLSTLHTNDAASAITRLMDIGIPHYLLTPSLVMIVAQRLGRKLCQKCKEPYEPTERVYEDYTIKADLIYKAKGCDECNHTGYKGRLVLAEVMMINDDIRRMMSKNATYNEIRDAARKSGMDTLFETAMRNVEQGITSIDEALGISLS